MVFPIELKNHVDAETGIALVCRTKDIRNEPERAIASFTGNCPVRRFPEGRPRYDLEFW